MRGGAPEHRLSTGCLGDRRCESGVVRIILSIDSVDPPRGTLATPNGASVEFDGWLDLIRILAEVFDIDSRD